MVGAPAVGKTSLIQRFVKNRFAADYKLTVGVDILSKDVEFNPGDFATLSIWDIGGQQRFEFIRTTFYKGLVGALIIFDLTREETYIEARKWLTEIRQYAGENLPFALIGNKADLIEDVGEVIDREGARAFAECERSFYIETSAKTGVNVEWAFTELTRRIVDSRGHIFEDTKALLVSEQQLICEQENLESLKLSSKFKDLVNLKIEEILKSLPKEEDGFRFLIIGNEELQKPLLSDLFRVEKIIWPPEALNILYNTINYKIKIGVKEHKFQVYFLSNLKRLKDNYDLFNEACKQSNGIIIFYDPSDKEDFTHATDMCIKLRNYFPEIEIILTTGSEDRSVPPNLALQRYLKLGRLEENYQINNYDDYESLLSEILINVLKRNKKLDQKKKFMKNELKKFQDQLSDQKADPDKIMKEMKEFIDSMEKRKKIDEVKKLKTEKPPISTPKKSIFISYSHKDKEWLERLQVHLKPLEREGIIKRWDDTLIKPGEDWLNEIRQVLTSTKVAILLVSADFLASDFIVNNELPPLLDSAKTQGTVILPVIVSPCRFSETKFLSQFTETTSLAQLQSINNPAKPLLSLTKNEQEAVFLEVARAVEEALGTR